MLAGTSTGVFKTRSIRRLAPSDRYPRELLESFESTPWNHKNDGIYYPRYLDAGNQAASSKPDPQAGIEEPVSQAPAEEAQPEEPVEPADPEIYYDQDSPAEDPDADAVPDQSPEGPAEAPSQQGEPSTRPLEDPGDSNERQVRRRLKLHMCLAERWFRV